MNEIYENPFFKFMLNTKAYQLLLNKYYISLISSFFKIPSAYFDKFLIVMYTGGSLVQVYMLCFSVQALLEAVKLQNYFKFFYEKKSYL